MLVADGNVRAASAPRPARELARTLSVDRGVRSRVTLAQRDVEHGLEVTLDYFTRREQQERALEILQFKLDILWTMLDSIEKAFPQ